MKASSIVAALALALAAPAALGQEPASPAVFQAGPLKVSAPWSRATPGGAKVAVGYMRITNTGPVPDRLVGGSMAVAGRFEVHATAEAGGVARMHPVEGGLVIGPGETVELKPGGLHAMMLDLKTPLKAGGTVKGTLVFEKAGPVEIVYRVAPAGAPGIEPAHRH